MMRIILWSLIIVFCITVIYINQKVLVFIEKVEKEVFTLAKQNVKKKKQVPKKQKKTEKKEEDIKKLPEEVKAGKEIIVHKLKPETGVQAEIQKVYYEYAKCFNNRDIDGLIALHSSKFNYPRDSILMDIYLEELYKTGRIKMEMDNLKILYSNDKKRARCVLKYHYKGVTNNGFLCNYKNSNIIRKDFLVKENGKWKFLKIDEKFIKNEK